MKDASLTERVRAKDILLGSLGFGEEAQIVSVERIEKGYRGIGTWKDGETFEFESKDDIDELQEWALRVVENERKAA